LYATDRLSHAARRAIDEAEQVWVSPASFFEIAQKFRLGKWPEMGAYVDALLDLLAEQGGVAADLGPTICLRAGGLVWSHRDPFDRMLAATAFALQVPIISADAAFDGIVQRVW
jgi:PIN domain nuclease of toxin-antitoxin system